MLNKFILAASALLLLSSCEPFEGLLTANQTLVVKSTESNKVVPVTIPQGQYDAKFEFASQDKIVINMKIADKKTKIRIKTNGKINIPENGDFLIAAATLGQDFHAAGKSETKQTMGPIRDGYESCTYQRRETYCYARPDGQTVCQDRWVTVNGRRWIEYQDRQTDKKINVGFYKDSSGYLATFKGEKSYTERVIRYEGQCY